MELSQSKNMFPALSAPVVVKHPLYGRSSRGRPSLSRRSTRNAGGHAGPPVQAIDTLEAPSSLFL
jgi:hypothetical protein